ncbi:hypothetical protein CRENBAI_012625 [Crenichthys baileyi]|uniref:Uncharacterized protein n=1 Tax=Crenichthys baileyi TaxID=28760 RepID=A0AAV9SJN0_9TELE
MLCKKRTIQLLLLPFLPPLYFSTPVSFLSSPATLCLSSNHTQIKRSHRVIPTPATTLTATSRLGLLFVEDPQSGYLPDDLTASIFSVFHNQCCCFFICGGGRAFDDLFVFFYF